MSVLNLFLLTSIVLTTTNTRCQGFSLDAGDTNTFAILGGTGRIGTAVASHLLLRAPDSRIVLVGRDEARGSSAVAEVLSENSSASRDNVSFQRADWRNANELQSVVSNSDCLIHTAGPFLGEQPSPLRAAIESNRCRTYIDVSDPLDYLELSLAMNEEAVEAGTTALLAAGAFPGMSNVMAVEAASKCLTDTRDERSVIQDVRFNYFTAGLGGSGDVNLYITNLGFGEAMAQYEGGKLRLFEALSGLLLGKVDFFLDTASGASSKEGFGNDVAKARIGAQTVFSWPFPEAATVPRELGALGNSSAAMGTAPDVWNGMLGLLVALVPRKLWRSRRFSQFLADFSRPLVEATDYLLKLSSPDAVGETHAMRVDVTCTNGRAVSIVQAHESFRRCVGQSCAEFALDVLEHPSAGVQLPEQRYRDSQARERIVQRLTTTPGTFAFTGPVAVSAAPPPTDMNKALEIANAAESKE